jgi:DtxR family manganese transport transcriptional regulator
MVAAARKSTSAGRSRKDRAAKRRRDSRQQAAAARQARRYTRIRRDHSGEIAEDYVELIAQLIHEHGEARTVDLAERLGVSHVTVTKTITRLQSDGLVRSEPYRSIFLTDAGTRLAQKSATRHELIVQFLQKLGVNRTDAETDAEGIEHHVSEATLTAMCRFLEQSDPAGPAS